MHQSGPVSTCSEALIREGSECQKPVSIGKGKNHFKGGERRGGGGGILSKTNKHVVTTTMALS